MPLRPSTGFVGADPAVTTPRGFDIVPTLSTRRQWFPCGPLPARHLTWFSPGLSLLRSLPWLLTTAAGGGLEPAPASRFRGASPHRWHSCALQRLFQPSSCSWRTVIGTANQEASALHPWPYLALEPFIQPMMEEYIGQHRGDHSPYKVANFFFGVRIARVRIDPKHDMHLVGGHFHPLHQGTDQCAFACPVCLLSSMMYRSGKVLQATNNQLQFAMLGGFIRQLATLLIDLRDTAAHTEDAWCKRVLVNEALGVTVDQARQTLPQLAEV